MPVPEIAEALYDLLLSRGFHSVPALRVRSVNFGLPVNFLPSNPLSSVYVMKKEKCGTVA